MSASLTVIGQTVKSTARVIKAHAHDKAFGERPGTLKVPRIIQTLLDLLGDDDLTAVVDVYRQAMSAERRFWVDQGKDENGRAKGYWESEPDHKTRITAANMVAAYMEGLPVSRAVSLRGEFSELGDMIKEMRLSGEARRLMPANSLPNTADEKG